MNIFTAKACFDIMHAVQVAIYILRISVQIKHLLTL
jgi:hypothetical protein